jgi:hypothetical protein
MPEAAEIPITIEQGETFRLKVTWGLKGETAVVAPDDAPASPVNGTIVFDTPDYFLFSDGSWWEFTPFDNTGGIARFQVRASPHPGRVYLELTDGDGVTLGGVDGSFELFAAAEDTAELDFNAGWHDLLFISGEGGDTTRIFQGPTTLSSGQT